MIRLSLTLLLTALSSHLFGDVVVEQNQINLAQSPTTHGQSFTWTSNNSLSKVSVASLNNFIGASFKIYDQELLCPQNPQPASSDTRVLYESTVNLTATVTQSFDSMMSPTYTLNGYTDIDITPALSLTNGSKYTFCFWFNGAGAIMADHRTTPNGLYSGGRLSYWSSYIDTDDMVFKLEDYITNAAPTDITLTSNTIDENAISATKVGTLSATDADDTTHTFTLIDGCIPYTAPSFKALPSPPSNDNASFTINGTNLESAAVFDYETKNSYNVCVKADDTKGGTYEKMMTVSVNNLDESTDGVCGLADGSSSITAPTSDLCSSGTASSVTQGVLATSFTWSCSGTTVGTDNGATDTCFATRQNDADGDNLPDSSEGTGEVIVTLPNSGSNGGNTDISFTYESTSGGSNPTTVASILTVTPTATPTTPPAEVSDSILSGAVSIQATSAIQGFTQKVVFTLPANSTSSFTGLWKFGPMGGMSGWYDFGTLAANASIAGREGTGYEISNGGKTLSLYLVDGKRGDDDMTANGTISDPSIPIVSAANASVSVPLFGPFGTLLLTALMGFFGYRRLKA